jgi:hypothetical protein
MNLDNNNIMDFISSITNNFVQFNPNGQNRNRNSTYTNNYSQQQPEEDLNSNESYENEYEEIDDDEAGVDQNEARRREYMEKRKERIEELNLFQYKNIDKFLTRKDE